MLGETDDTREEERGYPLLWAIVEFREELERLVETQLELIASRNEIEPAATPQVPSPTSYSSAPSNPAPSRFLYKQAAPASVVVEPPSREEPPTVPKPRVREPYERAASPVVRSAEPPEPANAKEHPPEDPRSRLDALAKLLDRRLKTPTPEHSSRSDDSDRSPRS